MPDQVKVPVVGPVGKRALWIGGGGAALVVAVLYWRKRSTALTPSTVDTSGTDTSAADTAGGGASGAGVSTAIPGAPVATVVTNAQWTANVMAALGQVPNLDLGALSAALGLYLTGSAVSTDQEHLIDQAIAAAGYPPVDGPNGYPPAIHTQPQTGQTPPPTPAPAPKPAPAPAPHTFTVKAWPLPGSSLSSIARIVYGDPNRWPAIYAANRARIGPNPNIIHAGQVLTIP